MSALEGLAALGLACNIFQVISFGRETLGLVKSIYHDGTLDNSLVDKIAVIQGVAANIIDVNIPQSGNQGKKLVDVTKKCTGVARDLQEEIAYLASQNGRGSLRATLNIAAKANWRKRRLDKMEKALSDAEHLMQTNLLAWIFKTANATSINIYSLKNDVRNFLIKYEQGFRQASQLVSSEALQVREVVVRQSGKTEEAIRAHVTRASEKLERKLDYKIEQTGREKLRERLLKSLKYPGMNERANQVENAHERTFRWLFADADDSSCSGHEKSCSYSSKGLDDQDMSSEGECSDDFTEDEYKEPGPQAVWSSFIDWLQSDLNIYWITGKPGSGKSTLAKFILSEPRFKTALAKWHRDTIIASHYFWRPGALLQRSIKGMFCSIIYQLVLSVPNALEYVSTNVTGLSQKDSDTDWSSAELQQLCFGLVRHCGKPLCLFVDGLDECGPEDNHQKLLEILDTIRLSNVKLIASSRNEPIFEKRFRHEPQLRMQDLTAKDLRNYATDVLSHDLPNEICENLVTNAEGVFLWLVLAVQSINRGSSNGESLSDLDKRIKSLPKGLNGLYKDMWSRLNDDCDLYRESAALYFKLAIAAHDTHLRCLKHGWSTLKMMLASFPNNHYAFGKRHVIPASKLVKECEQFQDKVAVRCAGLLDLDASQRSGDHSLKEGIGDTERALLDHADGGMKFRFIHRSAHDFLVDTVEGQNILGHDGTSPEDINMLIIRAHLRAVEYLHLMLGGAGKRYYVHCDRPYLADYLGDLSHIADARDAGVRELFSFCYELYTSSTLLLPQRDTHPTRIAAFFGAAARYTNLNHYSTSIIEKQLVGSETKSAVLLSVVTTRLENFPLKMIRWLLNLPDVDVNLKTPLLVLKDEDPVSTGLLDHVQESPFNTLLRTGIDLLAWTQSTSTRLWSQFLGLVSDFAIHGADFGSTLFLAIVLKYPTWARPDCHRGIPILYQIPGPDLSVYVRLERTDDDFMCVVALQATTLIQAMLASLLRTGVDQISIDEDGCSFGEDERSPWNVEEMISSLSQRCQESHNEANDRVLGFLQPSKNIDSSTYIDDMPYRLVSEHDSAYLMGMIRKYIFEDGSVRVDLEAGFRAVAARSPFSSIGFRDCMGDIGCFDEVAARKLQLEYPYGYINANRL